MAISVVKDKPLIVQVGKTATITDELHLDVDDTAYPDSAITYTITTAPTKGTLLKNGSPTSTFTQDDLNNDRVAYQETAPSGSQTSDTFFFKASDPGGDQTATTLFQINITPTPDTPVDLKAPPSLTVFDDLTAALHDVKLIDEGFKNSSYTMTLTANSGQFIASNAAWGNVLPVAISGWGTNSLTVTGPYQGFTSAFTSAPPLLSTLAYHATTAGHDTITISVTGLEDQTTATKTIDVDVLPGRNFVAIDDPTSSGNTGNLGQTRAFAINNAGQIIANQSIYSGGVFTPFSTGQNPNGAPLGLNDSGDFVGSWTSSGPFVFPSTTSGFILDNGTFTSVPGPQNQTFFQTINNNGVVAGFYYSLAIHQVGPNPIFGFIYDGTFHVIGPTETKPYGINDAGQVVGEVEQSGRSHGFVYGNGIFSLLDNPFGVETIVRDINNNGLMVGYFESQSGTHGFSYNQGSGQWTTIDVPGSFATYVYGVNDSGQLVGAYADANGLLHGFVGDIPPPLPHVAGNVDEWILFNGQWEESAQPGSHPAGYRVAAVADFTHDGHSDVLFSNTTTGALDEWVLVNGRWTGSVDLGAHPGSGWAVAGIGDFNGSLMSDILWHQFV